MHLQSERIFKQGSTTYYYSSLFFPSHIRSKVFDLYAFVRSADNFVDALPPQSAEFHEFVLETQRALQNGGKINSSVLRDQKIVNPIISRFAVLCEKHDIPYEWVEAFLHAMETDLSMQTYQTFKKLEQYMYGSANVIGLMLAKIMELPKECYPFAEALGEAMQFVNFLRDVQEDLRLGRVYIPKQDLQQFEIEDLAKEAKRYSQEFQRKFTYLIRFELTRYYALQKTAELGFKYIPKRLRTPIQTASDMYFWTAKQIEKNPLLVFERKIKPTKFQVFSTFAKNLLVGM